MTDTNSEHGGLRFRALLVDIDGTVIEGGRVLSGAQELLECARADGRRFAFVSNNSRSWPAEVAVFLTGLGLECSENEVLTAGHLAAQRAAEHSQRGVYVLGSHSLADMVTAAGGRVTKDDPDVVLIGLDFDLSYERLSLACRAIGAGAQVIAVNRDRINPTELGLEPGAGVLVHAVRTYGAGRMLVCGKPSPVLAHEAQRRLAASQEELLMVGDSVESDMLMAARAGIAGALLQTGVPDNAKKAQHSAVVGTFATLPELVSWLKR